MKTLVAFVTVFVLLSIPLTVFAETSTSSSRVQEVKQKAEEQRETVAAKLAAREASKSANLQNTLKKFKDQKKAKITKSISTNLNNVNSKLTANWLKKLDQTAEILSRLETKVAQAKQNGKDATEADKAITDAKTAIETARQAVQTQTAKNYTLTISSESKVGLEVKAARQGLHTDLTSVFEKVKAAKTAVVNAIRVAKGTLGESKDAK